MFVLFLRGRRADFKARAILVLRLRTANLLEGATLNRHYIDQFPLRRYVAFPQRPVEQLAQ